MFILNLLLTLISLSTPAADDPVALPEPAFDFALNPATGAVAALHPGKDEVVLYSKIESGANPKSVKATVGKLPLGIVFKRTATRAVFAVVCHDVRKMYLLDASTLALVKEIPLEIEWPSSCVASVNPADPVVWYCGGRGHESKAGRVNVDTLLDEGIVTGSNGRDSAMDFAISADGTMGYLRGPWSPSGFHSVQILPPGSSGPKAKFLQVHYDHRSTEPYVPDTAGDWTASGTQVFSKDLKQAAARLDVAPLLFLPDKPFCLGVDRSSLVVTSVNSWKPVGRVDLAAAPERSEGLRVDNPQADYKKFAPQKRLLYDAKGARILYCRGSGIQTVPLSSLNLPDEVWLAARIHPPAVLGLGSETRIPVDKVDARIAIELKSGPPGMRLDGGALVWTPSDEQVGRHTAKLRLSAKDQERMLDVSINVARPFVRLPFIPQGLLISPAGDVAVLYTNGGIGEPNREPKIAVLNLKTAGAPVQRQLTTAISAVAIDEKHVYVGLAESDAFLVLQRSDLTDVKRLFTNGRVKEFLVPSNGLLIAVSEDSATAFRRQGELEAQTVPFIGNGSRGRGNGPRWFAKDRIWVNGVVLDANLDTVHGLIGVGDFASRTYRSSARSFASDSDFPARWGVLLDGAGGLRRQSGQVIDQGRAAAATLLDDQPAVVQLQQEFTTATTRGTLIFRDLVSGLASLTIPLYDVAQDARFSGGYREQPRIVVTESLIAVTVQDALYLVKPPRLDPAKFPTPLHWRSAPGVHVAEATKLLVESAASGGTGPLRYSLQVEVPGIEIDRTTGTLQVDGSRMIENAARDLVMQGYAPQADGESASRRAYLPRAAAAFKKITGREAKGIPFAVRIGVSAQDANNQTAVNDVVILLDVPDDLVKRPEAAKKTLTDEERKKRVAQLERQIEELRKELQKLRDY